jgi:hypothetical protein
MADLRDRDKRAEGMAAVWAAVAVSVQAGWVSAIIWHWGRIGQRHNYLLTGIVIIGLASAAPWFARRYIRQLPSDAAAAALSQTGGTLTKERAAAIICGLGTPLVIWGLVAAGVTDDLQNGTSLGSPFIYVIAALAGVAAVPAVNIFVLWNLRRLPVTPDRPVVPRWPPAS